MNETTRFHIYKSTASSLDLISKHLGKWKRTKKCVTFFIKQIKPSLFDEKEFFFVINCSLYRLNAAEVAGKTYHLSTPSDRIFTHIQIITDFRQTDSTHVCVATNRDIYLVNQYTQETIFRFSRVTMVTSQLMKLPGFDPQHLPLIFTEGKVIDLSGSGTRVRLDAGGSKVIH